MATEVFEVSFTLPIFDFEGDENEVIPRWPWTDSPDGLFTVPAHYYRDGMPEEFNYSGRTDAYSSGAPSASPSGSSIASINNEGFRLAMLDVDLDAPSIRLRAKQTAGLLLPAQEQVAAASVSVKVVSRDSRPGVENVELDMAHGAPSALRGLLTMPPPAEELTTRTALLSSELTFGGIYELFAYHLANAWGEMQVFRSGPYPWGFHDITYMGLVITVETIEAVPYRRTSHRHDSLAGGATRNYPPSRALQTSNRIGGGYL